jgi:hypothetical protein
MKNAVRIIAIAFLLSVCCSNFASAASPGVTPTCSTCTGPVGGSK